jgi:NhaA family Na+:H+ antiporter
LGILLAALIAVKLAGATLPRHCGWLELTGVALLGGIGFTVSLFIAGLAFTGELADGAKIGILASSVLASILGATFLLVRGTGDPLTPTPRR